MLFGKKQKLRRHSVSDLETLTSEDKTITNSQDLCAETASESMHVFLCVSHPALPTCCPGRQSFACIFVCVTLTFFLIPLRFSTFPSLFTCTSTPCLYFCLVSSRVFVKSPTHFVCLFVWFRLILSDSKCSCSGFDDV